MVEHEGLSRNNELVIFTQVMKPHYKTLSIFHVPLCVACELARTNKQNPGMKQQKEIDEKRGILATDKYCAGDFVSMDQFVVKTPGRLPTGYGHEGLQN